jgi:7-cyano-7-deazaguanine synthase in queuosine biosynthesis
VRQARRQKQKQQRSVGEERSYLLFKILAAFILQGYAVKMTNICYKRQQAVELTMVREEIEKLGITYIEMFYFWLYSLLTNEVSVHSISQIKKNLLLINNINSSNNKSFLM